MELPEDLATLANYLGMRIRYDSDCEQWTVVDNTKAKVHTCKTLKAVRAFLGSWLEHVR